MATKKPTIEASMLTRLYAASGLTIAPVSKTGQPLRALGALETAATEADAEELWRATPDAGAGLVVGQQALALRIDDQADARFLSLLQLETPIFRDERGTVILLDGALETSAVTQAVAPGVVLVGDGDLVQLPSVVEAWQGLDWLKKKQPRAPVPPWLIEELVEYQSRLVEGQTSRFLALVSADADEPFELVALGKPLMSAYATSNNLAAVASAGDAHRLGNGIYVLGQRVDPALVFRSQAPGTWSPASKRAGDSDVRGLRYFYADFDPVRPSGTSATQDEFDAAREVVQDVQRLFRNAAGDCCSELMSGNGAALLLPLDGVAHPSFMAGWKHILDKLKVIFDTADVKVDTSVANTSRLVPMPGTCKRKGRSAYPRLHRRVHLDEGGCDRVEAAGLLASLNRELDVELTRVHSTVSSDLPPVSRGGNTNPVEDGEQAEEVRAVAMDLGLEVDGNRVQCPACGQPDALLGAHGVKCFHERCASHGTNGKGFYSIKAMVESKRSGALSETVTRGSARARSDIASFANRDWGPIHPLHAEVAGPPFPVEALPLTLRDWVDGVATDFQVPPDLPAVLALGALASASQRGFRVKPKPGWEMPTALYLTVAMESGTRKSPVFELAMRPIAELQAEERREAARGQRSEGIRRRLLAKNLEEAVAESLQNRERSKDVTRIEAELEKCAVAPMPMYLVSDLTPEAITRHLAEQNGHLTVASAEGEFFSIVAGRYSSAPALEVFMKAFSGEDTGSIRVHRTPIYIEKPSLSMVFAVQPSVLREAVSNARLRELGLLARFLVAVPRDNLGSREITTPQVSDEVLSAYSALIKAIHTQANAHASAKIVLSFTDASLAELNGFETLLEPRLAAYGDLRPHRAWVSKLAGQVARIAALLHIAKQGDVCQPIEVETVKSAIKIGLYFLEHEKIVAPTHGRSVVDFVLQKLLRAESVEKLTIRALFELVKGTVRTTQEMRAALYELEKHNYLRISRSTGVGRPSEVIEVNPAVASQYSQSYRREPQSAELACVSESLVSPPKTPRSSTGREPYVNTKGFRPVIGSLRDAVEAMQAAQRCRPPRGFTVIGSTRAMLDSMKMADKLYPRRAPKSSTRRF